DNGELVYIGQVPRGKTNFKRPYCGGLLLARKGDVNIHHFAHAGQTCRQVERGEDVIALPAYDNFNLHLPGKALKLLQDFHNDEEPSERQLEYLDSEFGVAQFNEWAGRGGS